MPVVSCPYPPHRPEEHRMSIQELADLVLAHTREELTRKGYLSQADTELVNVKAGTKYTKIDRGPNHNMSGMLMVSNATGEVFGIKGYGVPHLGHPYGTLATARDWYWGTFYPVQVAE